MTADRQLVLWLRGRHPESAMAELVRRYGTMVLRAAHRLTASLPAAEDVCQAVFLALARNRAAAARARFLGAWLHEVAVAASGQRQPAGDRPAAPASADGSGTGTPLPPDFDRALARLSPVRRAVLVDVGLRGLTVGDAAGHLGLRPEELPAIRDGALAALAIRPALRGEAGAVRRRLAAALDAEARLASAPEAAPGARGVAALSAAALGGARTSIQVLADAAVRSLRLRRLGRLALLTAAAGLLAAAAAAAAMLAFVA